MGKFVLPVHKLFGYHVGALQKILSNSSANQFFSYVGCMFLKAQFPKMFYIWDIHIFSINCNDNSFILRIKNRKMCPVC